MARWTAGRITSLPTVSDGGPDDPTWYPLQHALGIDAFGVNVFVSTRVDQTLVEEHDETTSGQQELYVILEGNAVFELDGEREELESGMALAVTDPGVRRSARAATSGTVLLVVGSGDGPFASTWDPSHFSDIQRPTR